MFVYVLNLIYELSMQSSMAGIHQVTQYLG
jgi:hypothetical protein